MRKMYDTLFDLILSAKYVMVFVLSFFLPTETVMPVVGYAASVGRISLFSAVIMGLLGTTIWSATIYTLARWVGPQGLNDFVKKYGGALGLNMKNVDRAGRWFDRHAETAVFVSKFVPGLRTAVCIPAGIRRMPFGRYICFSMLGSSLDVLLLAMLGYASTTYTYHLQMVIDRAHNVVVLGLVAIIVAWLFWQRIRRQ